MFIYEEILKLDTNRLRVLLRPTPEHLDSLAMLTGPRKRALVPGYLDGCPRALSNEILSRDVSGLVVTTNNAWVYNALYFESAREVRKTFVLPGPRWLIPDEANSFMKAYTVGIQHVSEILISFGWI